MAEKNLETLFHDTLRDMYYAERHILKTLPKLEEAAASDELKAARDRVARAVERLGPSYELRMQPLRCGAPCAQCKDQPQHTSLP